MKYYKSLAITSIVAIVSVFIVKIFLLDNLNMLFLIAEGRNEPSRSYHFILERIYKIASKKDIGKQLVQNIKEDRNKFLHLQYLRVLGVIGEKDAIAPVIKIYDELRDQKSGKAKSMRHSAIKCLGLIGDDQVVPYLEKAFDGNVPWLNAAIAASLYLLTGEKHVYVNHRGERQEFVLTRELIDARQVIEKTKIDNRKYADMLILDHTHRPPAD